MQTIFTKEQIDYMKDNYQNMSYKEIAEKLGFTERQIRGKLNNMGFKKLREINNHYFDEIDTPLKAYFLGYIYADGWIIFNSNKRNYELGMQLQSCDKYILEKLNEELGNKNIIYHQEAYEHEINGVITLSKDSDYLRIYSKNLVQGLMNNGISQNKTQNDIHPIVKDELFFDFLRGYIDGDGCFYNSKNSIYMHITCASLKTLEDIQNKLYQYEINTHIYMEKEKKYRLSCTNLIDMKKLVNHLYYEGDLFCLRRKYEKIQSLIGSAA